MIDDERLAADEAHVIEWGDLGPHYGSPRDYIDEVRRLRADNARLGAQLAEERDRADAGSREGSTDLNDLNQLYIYLFESGRFEHCGAVEDAWKELRDLRATFATLRHAAGLASHSIPSADDYSRAEAERRGLADGLGGVGTP